METRIISVLLLCMMLLTCVLMSCDTTGNGNTHTDTGLIVTPDNSETVIETLPPEGQLKLVEDGKTQFKLVRPDKFTTEQLNVIVSFKDTFKKKTGISIEFVYESEKNADNDDYEIVIGKSLHPESIDIYKDIKIDEYFYGVVGNKVIIAGGSEESLRKAVNAFIQNCIDKNISDDKTTLTLTVSENYYYQVQYPLDDFTICGTELRKYAIIYNPDSMYSEELLALKLKNAFQTHTGYIYNIYKDTSSEAANADHKIVIGKTKFTPDINLTGFEFSIEIKDGNVYLASTCLEGYDTIYDTIMSNVVNSGGGSFDNNFAYKDKAVMDEKTATLKSENASDIRVMFNNILGNCNDTIYPVLYRTKSVSEMLTSYNPDVLGLQECSPKSRSTYIVSILQRYGYKEVEVKATNSSGNNYTPLFYNPITVKVVESGYDYYDGSFNDGGSKSITWAVFDVIATGKKFAVCSTHFFYQSDAAEGRMENAKIIAARCKAIYDSYGCPVIMGGDLNTKLSTEPFKYLKENGLIDIRVNSTEWNTIKGSHAYPEFSPELGYYDTYYRPTSSYGDSIDHALCYGSESLQFDRFYVVTEPFALMSSDHCPIIVDFTFKN